MTNETSRAIDVVRRCIALPLMIGGIVIGAILVACAKERPHMTPSVTPSDVSSTAEPTVPPIDRDAPADTETATFAMG